VDTLLSPTRDRDAATAFFARALQTAGQAPVLVITAKQGSYPCAIRETLGSSVGHRTSRYLNNVMEQDHRPIKQRYSPMRGCGSFTSAARFCTAHEELRAYLRPRTRCNEVVSLATQRRLFQQRWAEVWTLLAAG
jgi:transposase-like protein